MARKGDDRTDELRCYRCWCKTGIVEVPVPESWKNAEDRRLTHTEAKGANKPAVDSSTTSRTKVNAQEGNTLPVSAFNDLM